ncbi:MAG: ABC transporter substrate-binding protein [Nitrosopumilus sp.]|nr:ABC transporter substrate-binding protein [Nitrosopumilus sp.]
MKQYVILGISVILLLVGGVLVISSTTTEYSYKIGIIKWVSNGQYEQNIFAFKSVFEEHGYFEGKNVEYLIETSNVNELRHREIVQMFLEENVDLIYSLTTPGTLIVKEMTSDIPIVFSVVTYPVETGIIENLLYSGNNIIGTRNYIPINEQFDFFNDIVSIEKIGFVNRLNEPNSTIQFDELNEYGKNNDIEIIGIHAKSLENLEEEILKEIDNVDALYQSCDTLIQSGGEEISIKIANEHKIPTFSCNLDGVRIGALAGNVADFSEIGTLSGLKALQILSGTSIDNLKTEGPQISYTIINLKTANSLGININESLINDTREIVS